MGDQQQQRGLAVARVPVGQALEGDGALERRDPAEQQHLDEHEVGAQQARDPAGARERVGGVRDLGDAARAQPQRDDRRQVGERHRRQERDHDLPSPEHACRHCGPQRRVRGRRTRTVVPAPSSDSMAIVPSCAATIEREIDSPSPLPRISPSRTVEAR